jgi:hypothetical protein
VEERCLKERPDLYSVGPDHGVRCFHYEKGDEDHG